MGDFLDKCVKIRTTELEFIGKMQITYCKSWFRAKKRPTEIWADKKALRLHKTGKLYTVLFGNLEKPVCFLEVHLAVDFVGVNFLDEQMRDYLVYKFEGVEQGKMFLSEVLFKEYEGTTDNILNSTQYLFSQTGKLVINEFDLVNQQTTRNESVNSVDISNNWELIPQFGDYSSIAKIERELNM